jgi:hypothetical protein
LPPGGFSPPGFPAGSRAFNLVFRPQVFKNALDHIHTDIRAPLLKFSHAERPLSPVDGLKNEACFLALGTLKLAEALLEFSIRQLDDGKNVIDIWPRIVFALVPALEALLQCFVYITESSLRIRFKVH